MNWEPIHTRYVSKNVSDFFSHVPRVPDVLDAPVYGDGVAGVAVEAVLAVDGVLDGLVLRVGVEIGRALLARARPGLVGLDRVPVVPVDLVGDVERLK